MADADTVRLLISDTGTGDAQVFSNDEIDVFLALEGDNVRLAAAQALDTIASNEAMVSKRIRTLGLSTDGPAVAKALRDHAARLRGQVAEALDAEDGGAFELTAASCHAERAEYPVDCY